MCWFWQSIRCLVFLPVMVTGVNAESTWTTLTDVSEIQRLFSNRASIMYKRYQQYYRADGVMVEFDPPSEWYTLRRWTVRDDGRLCWAIFTQPDHEVDCAAIQINEKGGYRYKWDNSNSGPPLEFIDTARPDLVEMLSEKAGPLTERQP